MLPTSHVVRPFGESMSVRALIVLCTLLLSWAAAVLAQTEAPAAGPGHLAVRGREIVDPAGRPILLRGWNWGHFGKAIEPDAADNAAQGANVVRIPLRWWGYYKGKGVESRNDAATATAGISPENLQILDDTVRWASRARLWIVLFIDSNCGQNGTQNAEMISYCDPGRQYRDGRNFWTDPAARAKFINVWRFIANRYKDTPYLGLFEPLPEPGAPATTPVQIQEFYTEVMAAIRQVAPGIPFLVGPPKYRAALVESAYNPAWKDVVYTGNLFYHVEGQESGNEGLRGRLRTLVDFRARHSVPIFVQQVGVRAGEDPDKSRVTAILNALVDNRVGFAYWEYRGANNPDEYGVLFRRGKAWQTNQPALSAISSTFKR
jgi:hypothetical protein